LTFPTQIQEFEIGLGVMKVVKESSILSVTGIGSCIALAMRDQETNASGVAHIVLPNSTNMEDARRTPGKYSDTAVRALVEGLLLIGASPDRIVAKMVGGASVLQSAGFDGARNIESTRNELKKCGVSIVAEDVGQAYGRTMRFETATGKIVVRRYQQLSGMASLKDVLLI